MEGVYFFLIQKEFYMIDYAFGSGEYYDNVDDLLRDDSILEVDITIKGLAKRVRIRALSFLQMEKINQQSSKNGEVDNIEFTVGTLAEGLVRPKMNTAQARKLLEANGEVVREIAENIWTLGKISKDMFDKYIETLQKDADLSADKSE
jgi:hypothetical protein